MTFTAPPSTRPVDPGGGPAAIRMDGDARGDTLAALLAARRSDPAVITAALAEGRARTWHLMEPLADDEMSTPATAYLSPPVWDLAHIANFEEQWLVQRLAGSVEMHEGYNDTYDALRHPRPERPALPLLDRTGVQRYMDEVRARTLAVLSRLELGGGSHADLRDRTDAPLRSGADTLVRDGTDANPRNGTDANPQDGTDTLLRDGFVHWMIVLHEHQHQETLLQTLQMRAAAGRYDPPWVRRLRPPRTGRIPPGFIEVPAGPFPMGRAPGPGVYDNESPVHDVDLPAFEIGRYPVTYGEYLRFMEEGGYDDASLWSRRGRAWLATEQAAAPLYWRRDPDRDGTWVRNGPGCSVPVTDWPDTILCHVTFFEAQAYARWADARLPTEAEWEKAARFDPTTGSVRGVNPWGDAPAKTHQANVDQLAFSPSRIGSHPAGASPVGAEHMIGDVWEWCTDGFSPYPGFRPFPYPAYSQEFFGGDYRMLRGGSWATRAGCATATFRNWDHPHRRQIMSGIRLARDA